MLSAENAEVLEAMNIFQEAEGIDLEPAAGVTFATLLKAAQQGQINRNGHILLHITGGDRQRRRQQCQLFAAESILTIDLQTISLEHAQDQVLAWVR